MTLVFAFDRDWTVDVNPHPRHEAVPIEWVRHLAHETDHAVYAIGNQDLAEEAAIPGVVDIVGRHDDPWDEWLGTKQPDGYYEQFPLRRERLALISDLHPNADDYIVVDDLDLSDVDGWEHYHAWDFVPAVEHGDIDPALPWAREPVTDGGLSTAAGVTPVDESHLSSWLTEHRDAQAFELTYSDANGESTALLSDMSVDAVRLEAPSKAPGVRCTPFAPGEDRFIIGIEAVRQVSVVEIPAEVAQRLTTQAETLTEEAVLLRRLAAANPNAVRISAVLSLLDREETAPLQQREALQALRPIAVARPEDCTPAIPILRSLLCDADLISPDDTLAILSSIGEQNPDAIAPATGEITPYLDSNRVAARREAAACIAHIATADPSEAVDAVPGLATVIEDDADGTHDAVAALTDVASEYPGAVAPVAEPLGTVVLDASQSDDVRLYATAALGSAVETEPGLAVDIVDDVAQLLTVENPRLRNNGVALLFEVSAIHTDVVEPFVDDIADLLTVDDAYTRTNASGTLARVAEDFPASVEHVTPTFVELLTDDESTVRENACWALGYLCAADSEDALQKCLQEDVDKDVRARASWALSRLEG
ncbi:HEAT repeat domain-containing protein [Haloarcula sp. S1CR25-12]|uniref:HEAT repeat domain-containing protein n=1 Tax=Haloarcula saliterrae TaxID=2950534 RepID=A0ABU2F8X3_9EURY|nr:HEAT repeat domain-containing protein [Haloarcula sp. S1CR25-12]MDS0258704.1 HEAT repeat domain-containing protein [Haloarcula sp. S1CR25-12]